jgi:hypothetical protein
VKYPNGLLVASIYLTMNFFELFGYICLANMVGVSMMVNYKRENSTEIHQSDNNPQSVNMEKQNPSCIDCGTLFFDPF